MTSIPMRKSILITGGAGFIGSHTADLLLQKNIPVTVLDNLSTGKKSNLNLSSPLLHFIQGDVLDYPSLVQALENCEAVLHLAALPSVPQSIKDPLHTHSVNTLGFLHLLQAIRELQRPIRLVYASSSAIYGNTTTLPCSDELVLQPVLLSPYALQKKQNEQYADLYARLFEIPSLALRYFNVYGPRQDPASVYSGVISRFLAQYQAGRQFTIFGDGTQARDFIHVEDVAKANYLALQGTYQGVLNIATGAPETLNKLVSYIEDLGKQKIGRAYTAPRQGDIHLSYAKTNKAEQALGFHYQIPLREGIRQLLSATGVV
ncbi:MAG TPA: NAD-dependent epimerase/dehydratase family protein [Gammaproteobacteria bacterium]|nr:NAD-dependent epimerase/dehydratase family protein [Gammaproteobacteria bacterium]